MFINKAALYKSPQWAYEKEWRLFLDKQNSYGLPYLCTEIHCCPNKLLTKKLNAVLG